MAEDRISSLKINWYPGHMTKARREMEEKIKLVDMVIELRDARAPLSSINPVLSEVIGNKPRVIILAKKDRADGRITPLWKQKFEQEGIKTIALDLLKDNVSKIISDACQEVMRDKIAKGKARGLKHVEVKAMVVGIPNVGKSTLINSVSRKKMAKTADHPGVTRSLTWIKVSSDVALMDTPGVLWPKFDDQEVAVKLALCGSIKEDVLLLDDILEYGLDYLSSHYPELLKGRYRLEDLSSKDAILNGIADNRKCLDANGAPDLNRAGLLRFREIKNGVVGNISWERPDENS
ncbi:MAG: ribosome biogenesis GTPase YlqF [Erysipelotrichaceae bacterium]|nr:ribosome biogenesis GTPase YlqF [Erysipelotrichaceae bacterium]